MAKALENNEEKGWGQVDVSSTKSDQDVKLGDLGDEGWGVLDDEDEENFLSKDDSSKEGDVSGSESSDDKDDDSNADWTDFLMSRRRLRRFH